MSAFQADAPGVGIAWAGALPVFGFGDGRLRVGERRVDAHEGGLLAIASCPSGKAAISAGDDGRVVRTEATGAPRVLLDAKGAWLDALAVSATGATLAVGAGREVRLAALDGSGEVGRLALDRAANALTFSADGRRLSAAHASGATTFDVASGAKVSETEGSGGLLSIAFSPDGRFLMAGTAEPSLVGWRVADGQGFRMANFPGKPLHFAWVQGGRALVTSGGPAVLAWPFDGPDGPMGEQAGVYRPRLGLCTAVATHGVACAAGWSDGAVDVVRLDTSKARHLAGPKPVAELTDDPRESLIRVSAVSFSPDGRRVAWCREDGLAGVTRIPGT